MREMREMREMTEMTEMRDGLRFRAMVIIRWTGLDPQYECCILRVPDGTGRVLYITPIPHGVPFFISAGPCFPWVPWLHPGFTLASPSLPGRKRAVGTNLSCENGSPASIRGNRSNSGTAPYSYTLPVRYSPHTGA